MTSLITNIFSVSWALPIICLDSLVPTVNRNFLIVPVQILAGIDATLLRLHGLFAALYFGTRQVKNI